MAEESEKQAETPEHAEGVDTEASPEPSGQASLDSSDAPEEFVSADDTAEEAAEDAEIESSSEDDIESEESAEAAVPAEEPAEVTAESESEEVQESVSEQAIEERAEPEEGEEAEEPAEITAESESEEVQESVSEQEIEERAEPEEGKEAEEADEGEEVAAEQPPLGPSDDEKYAGMSWYVIHAHSGHENKVRKSLENRVRQEHLEDTIGEILVPSEEVAEVKGGKKRIINRKIFPGYVLVRMKLSHQTWYLVRTTPGVTGFIGSGKNPTPLAPEEVQSIFEQMRGEQKKPKPKVEFEKDERVKIIEGPFTNFMGCVDEVNAERGKLKVMVEIFERLTSVELEFWQVEKV